MKGIEIIAIVFKMNNLHSFYQEWLFLWFCLEPFLKGELSTASFYEKSIQIKADVLDHKCAYIL